MTTTTTTTQRPQRQMSLSSTLSSPMPSGGARQRDPYGDPLPVRTRVAVDARSGRPWPTRKPSLLGREP